MKMALLVACGLLIGAHAANAQQRGGANGNGNGNNRQNGAQNRNNGVFDLPEGVRRVISIDAYNTLLAQQEDEDGNPAGFVSIPIRHVYSGGIAALFGGVSIPTAQFVSPGQFGGNRGNGGQNGFGGGQNGFGGGQNGFGGGQNGFGGGQNGFGGGQNGFGGGQNGFGGGQNGFGGNGFGFSSTTANNGQSGNIPLANGPFFP